MKYVFIVIQVKYNNAIRINNPAPITVPEGFEGRGEGPTEVPGGPSGLELEHAALRGAEPAVEVALLVHGRQAVLAHEVQVFVPFYGRVHRHLQLSGVDAREAPHHRELVEMVDMVSVC